jgi:hypothetical protein
VDHALQDGARELNQAFRHARAAAFLLAAPVLAGACSSTPADPVQALLAELESAAEARDAERFGERLSASFEATGAMGRAEAIATLRRYFAAYDSVALTVYDTQVARVGSGAQIRTIVEFSGRARKVAGLEGLLPPDAVYRFELEALEEGGSWRMRTARWQAVEPAASPPS